jgi:hypothetical protein
MTPLPAETTPNPRTVAIVVMYAHAAALATAGDLAGARALHEAIGRMLGADGTSGATVVDLNARQRSR